MMLIKDFAISGITCNECIKKITNRLLESNSISSVKMQFETPQITIHFREALSLLELQNLVSPKKNYLISNIQPNPKIEEPVVIEKSFKIYKPLILIVLFLLGICILVQFPFDSFSIKLAMRHFMAGFFIVFSFFKLLNIEGFANSYKMYDILSQKWGSWAYVYPFVELFLGVLYLINFQQDLTNWLTIIVLGLGSIGVIESNLNRRKIKCACLGDVFNLPMTSVTIIENGTMILMAALMLFLD